MQPHVPWKRTLEVGFSFTSAGLEITSIRTADPKATLDRHVLESTLLTERQPCTHIYTRLFTSAMKRMYTRQPNAALFSPSFTG